MGSRTIHPGARRLIGRLYALDGASPAARYIALSLLLLTLAALIERETLPTLALRFIRVGVAGPHLDEPCGSGPLPC